MGFNIGLSEMVGYDFDLLKVAGGWVGIRWDEILVDFDAIGYGCEKFY